MVSFGSAPLEQNQSREGSHLEAFPKSVLNAISQAVAMAMENHAHSREHKNES